MSGTILFIPATIITCSGPYIIGATLLPFPSILNILKETDFLSMLAELGVIVLMFTAGLESDIKELKSVGKSAFVVATMGVIIPLIGGTVVAYILMMEVYQM